MEVTQVDVITGQETQRNFTAQEISDNAEAQERDAPSFEVLINQYRILQTEVQVTYNSVTILNNQNERNILSRLDGDFKILNDDTFEIDFKNIADTKKIKVKDIQGLRKECFILEQQCYSAEAVVLANHISTPYTDIQDAYDDFDAEIGA